MITKFTETFETSADTNFFHEAGKLFLLQWHPVTAALSVKYLYLTVTRVFFGFLISLDTFVAN